MFCVWLENAYSRPNIGVLENVMWNYFDHLLIMSPPQQYDNTWHKYNTKITRVDFSYKLSAVFPGAYMAMQGGIRGFFPPGHDPFDL